jgi:hypothetical protein
VDFGVILHGGRIAFEADYVIEQSVIDTDLRGEDIPDNVLLEVINHVKGYADTTAEWIFGPGDDGIGGGRAAGATANGNAGSGEAPGEQGS